MKKTCTFQGASPIGAFWCPGGCLLFLAFFVFVSHALAVDNVWTKIGPYGGVVSTIAVDPSNPHVVYAGVGTGVFKSTNGGESWTSIPLSTSSTSTITVDLTNPQIIYVGGSKIFKSVNGGLSWSEINVGLSSTEGISKLVIAPSNPQTLYISTSKGAYRSTNGGEAWALINTNSRGMAIDPSNSQTLYVGGSSDILLKTTDGGTTWTSLNLGLTKGFAMMVAVDPSNPQTLYVGTDKYGVLKSTDGGGSWTPINTGLTDLGILGIRSIVIDPSRPQTLYIGTGVAGVYKSADGGASWTPAGSSPGGKVSIQRLAVAPSNPQTIYGGSSDGMFKSMDGGVSWTPINGGIATSTVWGLTKGSSNPQTLYAATGGGFCITKDGGTTWTKASADASNPSASSIQALTLAVDPTNPQTVYFESGPLYKSTDGGTTWTRIWSPTNLQTTEWRTDIRAIAVDPSNPQTIYLGMAAGASLVERRVLKTTDGGKTWTPVDSGLPSKIYVQSIEIDPSNPRTLYLAGSDGVFKSTDGGASWAILSNMPAEAGTSLRVLVVDPKNPRTSYAGGRSVYKSTDGGTSWTTLNSGLTTKGISSLTVDPANPQVVYAGTSDAGVYRSIDGGTSWTNFSTGLPSSAVLALSVDPVNQVVYAGTNGGSVFAVNVSSTKSLFVTDFDADGAVDLKDFFQFALIFGKKKGDAGFDARFDLDGDGVVDFSDFFIFVADFGKSARLAKAASSMPGINDHASLALSTVESGAEMTARISGANLSQLRGFSMVVSYDPSALTFMRAERPVDALLSQGGTTPLFLAREVAPGRVIVADVIAGSGTASGDGDLADLIFRPIRSEAGVVNVDLAQVLDGTGGVNTLSVVSHPTPSTYTLSQNYPNPFNPVTQIRFGLPRGERVRIDIYNIHGQRVRHLVDADYQAGYHVAQWDSRDDAGKNVASGLYLYRFTAGAFTQTQKMLLLK